MRARPLGDARERGRARTSRPTTRGSASSARPRRAASGGGGGGEADGKAIFTSEQGNCFSCHTLADAEADGTIGPNLDEDLADKDEAFIREAIVDPNKEIADGYQADVMPPNYGETCSRTRSMRW